MKTAVSQPSYLAERARRIVEAPFPRICAHRGLSRACPENTLPAFAGGFNALWRSPDNQEVQPTPPPNG